MDLDLLVSMLCFIHFSQVDSHCLDNKMQVSMIIIGLCESTCFE